MSKRKRFLITTGGFCRLDFLAFRYWMILCVSLQLQGYLVATLVFVWCLHEGLGRNMTLLSLILPFAFTVGVGLFWFLLPASIFTRIPVLFLYAFGIYSLALTMNIYTVSATRTIALLRAARGVGFVLTLVTGFLV